MTSKWNFVFFVPALLCLTSCAKKDEYIERPVDELYNEAYDSFQAQSYKSAAKKFDEVERQHPYSNWAMKAQLMSAYCHFASGQYGDAIEGLQVFLQLHPGHPHIAYAYYLLGLCYYSQVPTLQRDQKVTEDALNTFEEIIKRFPQTDYAKDAQIKVFMLHDHLAGKEMDIGRTYQARNYHLAAMKRFQGVVQNYGSTSYSKEALYRVVECAVALKLKDVVQVYLAILGHNASTTSWYKDAYALASKHYPELCQKNPVKRKP